VSIPGDRFALLQALLQGGVQQSAPFGQPLPANMAPTASQAPEVARDQQRQLLIQQLSQPAPQEQYPMPYKDPGILQKGVAGIADALGAYAAGLSGNNALNPHSVDMLRQRREMNEAARVASEQSGKRNKYEGDRTKAAYELSRMDREDDKASISAEREAERAARVAEQKAALAARASDQQADRELQAKLANDSAELRRELEKAQNDTQVKVAGIAAESRQREEKTRSESSIAKERATVGEAKASVLAVKAGAEEMLKTQTPGQLTDAYIESLDVRDLQGEPRKEAIKYFMDKMAPAFHKYYSAQANAEGAAQEAAQIRAMRPTSDTTWGRDR
jgi:hypothetical protein